MNSVATIYNPESDGNKRDIKRNGRIKTLDKFKKIVRHGLTDGGWVHETTNYEGQQISLEDIANNVYNNNPDVIAIVSGDGLVGLSLTEITKCYQKKKKEIPPIACLGKGKHNNLVKNLKIKNYYKFLDNVVQSEKVSDLTVKGIKMIRIKDEISGNEHLSFSAGTGLNISLLEEIYTLKHLPFKSLNVGYVLIRAAISAFIDGEYYKKFDHKRKLEITGEGIGGKEIHLEGDWLGIAAQSINSLGIPKIFEPRIFRNAETEGMFHAIGTTVGFRKLAKYSLPLALGESPYYKDKATNDVKAILELNNQFKWMRIENKEQPFGFTFGGETKYQGEPLITTELYLGVDKCVYFVIDDFKKKKLTKKV